MKNHNRHEYKETYLPEFLIPLYNLIHWKIAMWKAKGFYKNIKQEGDLT